MSHAHLSSEFHRAKNYPLTMNKLSKGSMQKVWWKCSNSHEWEASPSTRVRGHGCPYCSGRLPVPGETDLASQYPSIAKEWHPTKNTVTPGMVTVFSNKKVWWLAACNHEWSCSVANRTANKQKCPFCFGKKVLQGFNDLATIKPEVLVVWSKKNDLTPYEVTASSAKKIWLSCSLNHEWETRVYDYTRNTGLCPYCSGSKLLTGLNDLATIYPEVAEEWHGERNNSLSPRQLLPGSGLVVWWQCTSGHQWKAQVNSRTSGRGCPSCKNAGSSKVEKGFLACLDKALRGIEPATIKTTFQIKPIKVDGLIILNNLKIVFEYDGYRWHSEDNVYLKDTRKTDSLLGDGYLVIRVRETSLSGQKLRAINIKDDRLFQIEHMYKPDHRNVQKDADRIIKWILSKEDI